ncbi:hypothetical protein [Bacillus chungangensis]|uniref:Transposase n=1 Tax=Bacillus chungangensis TaxID=587633 RepID=A0ABT9WU58_9BACI|nr:hypothetical protein [Bacillus chungangensis]MDQ0176757.1 hypothetical protein [Bacillus chungangensis]
MFSTIVLVFRFFDQRALLNRQNLQFVSSQKKGTQNILKHAIKYVFEMNSRRHLVIVVKTTIT